MKILKSKYKRFTHKLTARHSYGFGVHSPFLFSFTKFVIYEKNPFYVFKEIEALVRKTGAERKLGQCKLSSSPAQIDFELSPKMKRNRQLLFRVVKDLKPGSILEIGASVGISTLYLASANPQSVCTSIVSTEEEAAELKKKCDSFRLQNVKVLNNDLKASLSQFTAENRSVDLLFINPSVSVEDALFCFEHCLPFINNNTVFIFSDIHRSKDSEAAWKAMTMHKKLSAYIDLYSFGFLFFKKDLIKKRYKMRF